MVKLNGQKSGYRTLLGERNYIKSLSARIINRFGDSIDALAFSWMVYALTGQRAWSAFIFGLNALPTILLMPFAGVLVERFDKRRVMILADLGRAALVSCIATLYAAGLAQAWMLAVSTFLMSTLEAFRIPAGIGLFPKIVPREQYTTANSLSQAAAGISVILGTGAFGPVTALWGLQGAMLVNAATFCISALLILSIRLPKTEKPATPLVFSAFFQSLREGVSYFYGKRLVFLICAAGSLIGVLSVPLNSLLAPYVQESLGQGEYALSLIQGAMMAGLLLGTVLFPFIARRVRRVALFTLGGLLSACGYFVCAAAPHIPFLPAALAVLGSYSFVMGIGAAFINVVVNVVFMEQVPGDYLGRIGALFNAMAMSLVPVASFAVAGAALYVTADVIFVVCGAFGAALFLVLGRNKTFRGIEAVPAREKEEEAL